MAAPSDALSSTLSAALEQVSVGSVTPAAATATALVDPATAARENETLLSALELSAASSLEHVLAREVAVSCGLAAGSVHGGASIMYITLVASISRKSSQSRNPPFTWCPLGTFVGRSPT